MMERGIRALMNALLFHAMPPGDGGADPCAEADSAYGRGDYVTASRLLAPLAGGGNADAQYRLGTLYDNGEGVLRNIAEAVTWYRRAAEQGHACAQCRVGRHHHLGEGVQQDPAEAAKWYRLSAEQGDPDAQHGLGYLCSQGLGVPRDPVEAVKWFRLAAEHGHAGGQYSLGHMYLNGIGAPRDCADAVKWLRLAAEQGYAPGQNLLGQCCDTGEGVPHDPAEAAKWFRLAAEQGHASAQFALGHMLDTGTGVPRDAAEATIWYRRAAEQRHREATYNLSLKNRGLQAVPRGGIPKGRAGWVAWLRRAAEEGDREAQYFLGYVYEHAHAERVSRNLDEAARWYRLASDNGHAQARRTLGHLHANGDIPPVVRALRTGAVASGVNQRQGEGEPTKFVHWPTVTSDKARLADWVQPVWQDAEESNWAHVFDRLLEVGGYVNACCPFNAAQNTFLHLAAGQGAPVEVVRRLLDCGAWRTLRNASGQRPVDIATMKGHSHLLGLLEPDYQRQVPLDDLMKVQNTFHELIKWRAGALVDQYAQVLPQLEPMLELEKATFCFEVINWVGGFGCQLEGHGKDFKLKTHSRVRVADDSYMQHEITPAGIRLIDAGCN